jgi:deoxyribodipyrimidine photolyase-related protein
MGKAINIIFPHQLFKNDSILKSYKEVYLIEEFLFFKQYRFHKQKIAFHRASMKHYQQYLENKGIKVKYIDSENHLSDIRNFSDEIIGNKITEITVIDPTDNWLTNRLKKVAEGINLNFSENQQFLNSRKELSSFFRKDKKSFFQTIFYKQQRKRFGILVDQSQNPIGGKWTYDTENRKKYPKGKTPPIINFPSSSVFWDEALEYTEKFFPNNPGNVTSNRIYPITHAEAEEWFEQFLDFRFHDFGIYEDAIVRNQSFLNHSLLSPLLNVGLLLPGNIVNKSLAYAENKNIPINSLEGFIRQIVGWREFIRGMYEIKGSFSRSRNFWNFNKKIPQSFYTGTTGIEPVDVTIKKVLETGYCHHIERLMILGNFMLLCEFDPDEVYQWFMELFIDAFDWVMVPNIYGMSQFADGGTFATNPYISGSNYIKKMSDYQGGGWEKVWDGLFWRFISKHQDFFKSNPRLSMLVNSYNRMSGEKQRGHVQVAEEFVQEQLK